MTALTAAPLILFFSPPNILLRKLQTHGTFYLSPIHSVGEGGTPTVGLRGRLDTAPRHWTQHPRHWTDEVISHIYSQPGAGGHHPPCRAKRSCTWAHSEQAGAVGAGSAVSGGRGGPLAPWEGVTGLAE